jgi:hypothetical protein
MTAPAEPTLAPATPPLPPPAGPSLPDRLWGMVRSDFALHGLAYLGVLLTFTGTLGFVLFAFNTVSVPLRATAGIAIPTILFLTAWFLYRRGSVLVAHSLETLAAAVTPMALFADLSLFFHRGLLTTLQITVALLLMVAYWVFWQRRPTSPLRFLVAGAFWAAAWASGFYFQSGYSATQVALTSAAILATVAASRIRINHGLAAPTRVAAIPATVAVYVLLILFAISQAPALPLLLAGLAIILTVEFLAMHSSRRLEVSVIQPLLFASLALAVSRLLDIAVLGPLIAIAFLALLEWQERRRPHVVGIALAAAGIVAGLSVSLVDPWASVVAFATLSLWMHLRRLRPTPSMAGLPRSWSLPVILSVTAALPIGLAAGLLRALPAGRGLLSIGLIAIVIAIAVRRFVPRDLFYAYWLPAVAGAAVVTAIALPGPLSWERVAAFSLLGGALAIAPRWPAVRIWTAGVTLTWAALAALELARVPIDARIAAVAAAALVLVVLGETRRFAPTASVPVAGQLAAFGFLLGLGALIASNPGWSRIVALSAWVLALAVATVSHEVGGSAIVTLLTRLARPVRLSALAVALLPIVLAASVPFLVVDLGGQLGFLTGRRGLAGVVLALTALAYAAVTRPLRGRRPLAPIAATSGVLLSAVGIAVAAPELWPVIASVSVSIAIVFVIGGELRRGFMTWFAWLMSIVLLLLLAHALGVPTRSLHLVLLGVGALFLVAPLLYDDLAAGRRQVGGGLRHSWLMRPVALGALAIPAGLAFTFPQGARSFGWWSFAAAALYLVVAVQLRAGAVTGASYALAAFGLTVLTPWHPLDQPWLFVPIALILVVLSAALARLQPKTGDLVAAWDLPPFVVAHLVGGLALARAVGLGSVAPTWSAFGALCLAVAVWRWHWAWAAAGVGLLLVGANAAGPGWLALALLVTAVVTIVIAQRAKGMLRTAMRVATIVAAGWAWQSALVWRGLSVDQSVATTALLFGAVWLVLAALGRRWLAADWLIASGSLATVAIAAAVFTGATVGHQRHPFALAVAGGLALHAAGTALAARPLRWPYLRELAALITALAVGTAIYDVQPSLTVSGGALATLGAAGVGAALGLARFRIGSAWLRPLLLAGGLANLGAIGYGVAAWPLRGLVIAVLLLLAVEAAATSLAVHRREPLYLVPPFVCGAWLAFATEALAGNPNWVTVPIGIAALAVVELFRHDRRAAQLPPGNRDLLVLEYAGMAFVVGASLVQTVSDTVAYGLLAIALGAGLAVWGFITRVRRRTEVGAGAILVAVILMVAVPVVRIIPQFQGAALWGALAAVGVVLLVVATSLEQGRSRVKRTIRRFEELMVGWE